MGGSVWRGLEKWESGAAEGEMTGTSLYTDGPGLG